MYSYMNENGTVTKKDAPTTIKEHTIYLNSYLELFEYEYLINPNYYTKDSLRKIRKFIMNIVHSDKKEISESDNETQSLNTIASEINNAIDFLISKLN